MVIKCPMTVYFLARSVIQIVHIQGKLFINRVDGKYAYSTLHTVFQYMYSLFYAETGKHLGNNYM